MKILIRYLVIRSYKLSTSTCETYICFQFGKEWWLFWGYQLYDAGWVGECVVCERQTRREGGEREGRRKEQS